MSSIRQLYRWAAGSLVVLAMLPGYYAVTLRWTPPADFDVTGVLFLIQNVPRLTAIGLTLLALLGAVVLVVRSNRLG